MVYIDEVFNEHLELANSSRALKQAYWTGYAAGVMRGRFGDVAVADRYHDEWLRRDAAGELAQGYRDGFARLAGLNGTRRSVEPVLT